MWISHPRNVLGSPVAITVHYRPGAHLRQAMRTDLSSTGSSFLTQREFSVSSPAAYGNFNRHSFPQGQRIGRLVSGGAG